MLEPDRQAAESIVVQLERGQAHHKLQRPRQDLQSSAREVELDRSRVQRKPPVPVPNSLGLHLRLCAMHISVRGFQHTQLRVRTCRAVGGARAGPGLSVA